MKKENILNLILLVALGVSIVFATAYAATTISTNILTEGTLTVVGTSELASTTISDLTVTGKTNGVKVYRAHIAQSGTDTPSVTVLENTLGADIVWTHGDVGELWGTLSSGTFPLQKTFLHNNPSTIINIVTGAVQQYNWFLRFDNKVELIKISALDGKMDDIDLDCMIEILVYP